MTTSARYARGTLFAENLKAGFGTQMSLSGHYDCINCGGSVSALFGFLVIAFGVLIFGVYAVKQRRQSQSPPKEPAETKVQVDQEGWETKTSDSEETGMNVSESEGGWQTMAPERDESTEAGDSSDDGGWETKPES